MPFVTLDSNNKIVQELSISDILGKLIYIDESLNMNNSILEN